MAAASVLEQIAIEVSPLPREQQQQVLDYARRVARGRPRGTTGHRLLRFAGTIPAQDLARMAAAIEEGCEQMDPDGW